MKKSKKLSLVLMGGLALTACGGGGSDQPTVFKDKAECIASGRFSEEQCAKMEADALAERPKFATREECVKQFGEDMCRQESGGGGFFMPMLMGFMAGQLLGGNKAVPAQGVYADPRGGGYQTAKGSPVGRAVSRGGFSSGGKAIGA